MFTIRICELNIEIDNRYGLVEDQCRAYLTDGAPAFRAAVSSRETDEYIRACGRPMTAAEAESALLYRRICGCMPDYDAFLLHAAVLTMDGRGYAFSARRGTGKTTHVAMWKQAYGSRVTVVNGDKPLVRRMADGHYRVYGTPWCGKEGENANLSVPLNAICFLEQGPRNVITDNPAADTVARILEATILPPEEAAQDRMAALIGAVTRDIPAYLLYCLPDKSAAELAYATLQQVRN
ncbi:MAG: hypothetical protein MJ192_06600 [Clostridia bacterium]|nr:hypothetical protein [Clostridia bacterium]